MFESEVCVTIVDSTTVAVLTAAASTTVCVTLETESIVIR